MLNAVVGIDVSKNDLSIAIIIDDKTHQINICNTMIGFKSFSKWLKQNKVIKVKACMESTGIYGIFFANYLYEQNHDISIVNPVCINAFARSKLARHKTDKVDSLIIAEYATKYELRPYKPKDSVMSELKDLYRCLQNLKDQQKHINNLLENKDHIARNVCRSYSRIQKFLSSEMASIEKQIDELLDQNRVLKQDIDNITTIPGVGKLTAIAIFAETPDLSLFKDARQVAAFAGLTPKHHSSGTSINKKSRISKIGSKTLRKALYFPAIVAKNHNEIFKIFAAKMQKKGKPTKVIIIAIMRKLLHIIFGIVKNKNQFNPNLYLDS